MYIYIFSHAHNHTHTGMIPLSKYIQQMHTHASKQTICIEKTLKMFTKI